MSILTLDNVSLNIGDQELVKQLSLQINAGERWAILGRNGVGKTSLLHSMAGLQQIAHGQVLLANKNIQEIPRKDIAKQLGVLLQQQEQSFPARVYDLVEMGRHPHQTTWQESSDVDKVAIDHALEALSLMPLSERNSQTLSGGEMRRVEIATVFAQTPQLYLLDEPINHLDIAYQIDILQQLQVKTLNDQASVVMVLHDINMAAQFCDHVLMLFGDTEYAQGRSCDLLNEENLERLYRQKFIRSQIQGKDYFSASLV